jgi:hypothetical protein
MRPLYSILLAFLAVFSFGTEAMAQGTADYLPIVTVQPLYDPDGEVFGEPVAAAQIRFEWLGMSTSLLIGPLLPPNSVPVSFMIALPEEDVEAPTEEKPHRGRIQIQGPDMNPELSWAWAQDTPPTKAEALAKLDELVGKLTAKQKEAREDAIKRYASLLRKHPRLELMLNTSIHGQMTKIQRKESILKYGRVKRLRGNRQNTNRLKM